MSGAVVAVDLYCVVLERTSIDSITTNPCGEPRTFNNYISVRVSARVSVSEAKIGLGFRLFPLGFF